MNGVLVIGASGNVGRQVLSQLQATDAHVRALTRNPESVRLPSYVDVVRGDLTVSESLQAPLEEIDRVFLVWTAPPRTVASVLERIATHARRIVFLSSPYKTIWCSRSLTLPARNDYPGLTNGGREYRANLFTDPSATATARDQTKGICSIQTRRRRCCSAGVSAGQR